MISTETIKAIARRVFNEKNIMWRAAEGKDEILAKCAWKDRTWAEEVIAHCEAGTLTERDEYFAKVFGTAEELAEKAEKAKTAEVAETEAETDTNNNEEENDTMITNNTNINTESETVTIAQADAGCVWDETGNEIEQCCDEEEFERINTVALVEEITEAVTKTTARSAWDKGVKEYALEMLEDMAFNAEHGYLDSDSFSNRKMLMNALLNGADDWNQYSWGGSALIYDGDIAKRLCNASELKKTRNGERKPNSSEEWLDTQARALGQAARLIINQVCFPVGA